MKYYNTSLGNCAAPSSGVYQVSNTLIRKPPLVRAPCTAIGIAPLLFSLIHPSPRSRHGYVLRYVRTATFMPARLLFVEPPSRGDSKLEIENSKGFNCDCNGRIDEKRSITKTLAFRGFYRLFSFSLYGVCAARSRDPATNC